MPLRFDGDAETVHQFATASFSDLVDQLEAWIARCSSRVRAGNRPAGAARYAVKTLFNANMLWSPTGRIC